MYLTLLLLCITETVFSTGISGEHRIILATATSPDHSGLLDAILPVFIRQYGYEVDVISVGTGRALELGRRDDADLIIGHSPDHEMNFVNDGYGLDRVEFMYNDFVLIGPQDDPAQVGGSPTILSAFERLAESHAVFISRGDESGTHIREISIWSSIDIEPDNDWYREIGSGMAQAITVASEADAYTLVDRGTWMAMRDETHLKLLFEDRVNLKNTYSILLVDQEGTRMMRSGGALLLMDWLTSRKAQQLIGLYRIDGRTLYHPMYPD